MEAEVKWRKQLKIRDYKAENKMSTDARTFSLAFDWIQNNDATSG